MKIHTHPIILSILLFCFAAGAFFVGHMALSYATFQATENFCVLLDAGHGGADRRLSGGPGGLPVPRLRAGPGGLHDAGGGPAVRRL